MKNLILSYLFTKESDSKIIKQEPRNNFNNIETVFYYRELLNLPKFWIFLDNDVLFSGIKHTLYKIIN